MKGKDRKSEEKNPSPKEVFWEEEVAPERVLDELVAKYLPEIMPQILPDLLSRLMSLLLAKPENIKPEWLEYLAEEFDLPGFVKAYYEKPFGPEELSAIIGQYETEDAVYMVYAIAAYIKYNRMKTKFPGAGGIRPIQRRGDKGTISDREIGRGLKKSLKTIKNKEALSGGAQQPADDESFPNSEKMQIMAEAWREYSPGPGEETLRQCLARSLNTLGRKEWMEEMGKALKKTGAKKEKVGNSDYSNFKVSSALKGLIKSRSGL